MSEETTKNLGGEESFETRVLAELGAINSRLTSLEGKFETFNGRLNSLEEKVDARLHDTRPIWESVLSQLKMIDTKFDVHAHDMLELRAKMRDLEQRVPPAA